MTNKKITLTYVEAFLLSTQSMSALALHQQYNVVVDQSNQITCLSSDLRKISSELVALKATNINATPQATVKMSNGILSSDIFSFLDPKIILWIVGTGAVYYYVIPALTGALSLPSLKSFLIPVKSAIISIIPFMKEETTYEFIKDSCVYRVKILGDRVIGLDARNADAVNFSPVSDLINKSSDIVQASIPTEPLSLTMGQQTSLDIAAAAATTEDVLTHTSAMLASL